MADILRNDVIPPFLTKTYDMVDNRATDAVISWSEGNNSFVVWNPAEFSRELLPKFFKHNNFSSFIRQLNTYGFRKVDPDRYEFAHKGFLRGRSDLLKGIHRRRRSASHSFFDNISRQPPQPHQGCQISDQSSGMEVGNQVALEGEIETLKNDRNTMVQELVRLHQLQQNIEQQLQAMEQRVLATENKQQQMMSFLAKALQDPRFLAQLLRQSESHHNNRLDTMRGRKQRFLKHDTTGSEEQRMLNKDSAQQQEGQMMPYYNNNQPSNGDVNPMETDDEAVITQLLDSIEAILSPTSPDDNSEQLLDVLFRSSSPSDHPELTTPSGVTLTELDMSGLPESTLPVANPVMGTRAPLDDQELQELLELQAPPASQTSGLETGASSLEIDSSLNPTEKTNTETGKMNSSNDHSLGASSALETSLCDGEGMSSCTGSPAANKDEILWDWEHFFSPASISPLDLVPSKIDFGATDQIPELGEF